jgi:5-methylcytosine-specific restriction endonuclease McrA
MTYLLHQAIADLLDHIQKTDSTLGKLEADAQSIEDRYDPTTLARQQYDNWRATDEGKTWKQEQFKCIDGVCPECSVVFPTIDSFHIDHIHPLSKRPDLATEVSNLRLLCSRCNLSKGKKDPDARSTV